MKAKNAFADAFENTLNLSDGKIKDLRIKAFEEFSRVGIPTNKDEFWKYSDPSVILKLNLEFNDTGSTDEDDFDVILVNGKIVKSVNNCKTGTITDGLLEGCLDENILGHKENPFMNLNNAFAINGCYIILEPNTKNEIRILNLITNEERQQAVYPKFAIVAGKNSNSSIFEEVRTIGKGHNFVNSVMDFIIEDGAILEHTILDDFAEDTYHIANICVQQGKDSNFISHNFSAGKRLARRDFNVELLGTGANCDLNGIYLVDGDNHIDHHTTIEHKKNNCTSNEHYKGILDGNSKGIFNGRIHVHPDAQKTDAIQNNQNLLLSDDAIIHTKPELEIYADDVKCTHGATVGQLDDKAMFYLRTRGINKKDARKLLMRAYVGEIIEKISNESIRAEIMKAVLERLPKGEG
jgi:Fe-S cluster assembly protein SufD